jgi:site-specific recombinase XerD
VTAAPSHETLAGTWLAELESPRTREAYARDLAGFVAWCQANGDALLEVGAADIDDYRDHCGDQGVLPATISRRLSALASFYAHALAMRAVVANPVVTVHRPVAPQQSRAPGLDERDALALLDAASAVGAKAAVLVALLLLEGMKLAEVLAIDVEHLEGSGWAMRVNVTRRGRPAAMTLDGRTARAVAVYLAGRTHGPLLTGDSPTRDGDRLTRFGADFLLKRAAQRAGLQPLSANTLRRSHIELSHRGGTAVEDIAVRVGHASARDTRRYLP